MSNLDRWRLLGLTPQEARAAEMLYTTECIVHRLDLLFAITDDAEPKLVDVVICRVRRKLQPHGCTIRTVSGQGYAWEAGDPFAEAAA